ncbi:MAG: hypothetical protein VKP70_05680 [Cyanobacteriota bacterium]|nr:hypothetical protein [Cyanobacteriota bacterium]
MLRGGSWFNEPHNCRSAYRNSNHPANHNNNVGFRVCCLPPAPFIARAVGWESSGRAPRGPDPLPRSPPAGPGSAQRQWGGTRARGLGHPRFFPHFLDALVDPVLQRWKARPPPNLNAPHAHPTATSARP